MKWLKDRNVFLLSEGRSEEISIETFDKVIDVKCQMWVKHRKESPLFRGVNMDQTVAYINPKEHTRSSIEEEQIHIGVLSDDPTWSEFPKYNKSLIGGTTRETCYQYGDNIYEVIPFDNANITFCPTTTVWGGFRHKDHNGDFVSGIYIVTHFLEEIGIGISVQSDWNFVKKSLLDMGKEHLFGRIKREAYDTSYNDFMSVVSVVIGEKESYTSEEIIETIIDVFNPKDKGFFNVKYDDNWNKQYLELVLDQNGHGVQFWTDSECLLIRL